MEGFISLQRDAAAQPAYAIAMLQDISERKRLEDTIRRDREDRRRRFRVLAWVSERRFVLYVPEIEAATTDPLQQLRLLIKRVSALAAGDRVELALLATADHPAVKPVLDHVARQRLAFIAELLERLGFSRPAARRRALLAYTTYLGYAQAVHSTPEVLPQSQAGRRAYLNDTLAALTSPR